MQIDELRNRLGGLPASGRGPGHLARALVRGSTSLHGDRGQHARPEAGRGAPRAGTGRRQQGAGRVHGGQGLRRRRRLGLQPGNPTIDDHGVEIMTMAEVRHIHQMAMTPVWDVAPHPQATATGTSGFLSGARHPAVPRRDDSVQLAARRGRHRLVDRTVNTLEPQNGHSPNNWPTSTPNSSGSTRSSTATAGPGVSCST